MVFGSSGGSAAFSLQFLNKQHKSNCHTKSHCCNSFFCVGFKKWHIRSPLFSWSILHCQYQNLLHKWQWLHWFFSQRSSFGISSQTQILKIYIHIFFRPEVCAVLRNLFLRIGSVYNVQAESDSPATHHHGLKLVNGGVHHIHGQQS